MIVAKFSTLAGGVFIEETGKAGRAPSDRCFRFDEDGNAEYAFYGDLTGINPAPRWFGHVYKAKDFVLA